MQRQTWKNYKYPNVDMIDKMNQTSNYMSQIIRIKAREYKSLLKVPVDDFDLEDIDVGILSETNLLESLDIGV